MLRTGRLITALALAALVASALRAQGLAEVCRAMSDAKIGQWASYHVTGSRMEGDARFAAVSSEPAGDSTLVWFEMRFTSRAGDNGVIQVLVPGIGARGGSIHRMVVKSGSQAAIKLSDQMIAMMGQRMAQTNPTFEWSKRCNGATVVGWESVTVPAGSLRALHVKSQEGDDAWVSRDIPFGLVKVHGKDDIVLTGHGADAKSSITEKPQEMPGMMLPKP